MSTAPDLYKILELSAGATAAQIQQAYKRLCKIHHPDKNIKNKAQCEAKTQDLNHAIEVLGDSEFKSIYDTQGYDAVKKAITDRAARQHVAGETEYTESIARAKRDEADRLAALERARLEAEERDRVARLAAQEQAKREAEERERARLVAVQERLKREAERRAEAERLAAQQKAQREAEEQAKREEAKAKREAEAKAAEATKKEAEARREMFQRMRREAEQRDADQLARRDTEEQQRAEFLRRRELYKKMELEKQRQAQELLAQQKRLEEERQAQEMVEQQRELAEKQRRLEEEKQKLAKLKLQRLELERLKADLERKQKQEKQSSSEDHENEQQSDNFTNVFIKNLANDVTVDCLSNELFQEYHIITCEIRHNRNLNYGFVKFKTHEDAASAIESLNNSVFHGITLHLSRAMSRDEQDNDLVEGKVVYVKNLDECVSDIELLSLFDEYGNVSSASIQRDADGESRGYGFVRFANKDGAKAAIKALHNAMLYDKKLYVAQAQRRSNRMQDLIKKFGSF